MPALGGADAESGSEEELTGADDVGADDDADELNARLPMVDRVVHAEDGGAGWGGGVTGSPWWNVEPP